MSRGLYFYKLQSPYPDDVTKNCKLTINEIDSNFLTLKDADIASAMFDKENETLVLIRNNGDKIVADLSDGTYNLEVSQTPTSQGLNLTFTYATDNEEKTVTVENIVTVDNLKELIGKAIITDSTLSGNGTIDNPLGIKGVERTGFLAPVKGILDLTKGGRLPHHAKPGTRYITSEYVNDYGYLYNGQGLKKIMQSLSKSHRGWRVPTKADWDKLLNSLEPCEHQNHDSARCHAELGFLAGKFLKSECGWIDQPNCVCGKNKPINMGCGCGRPIYDGPDGPHGPFPHDPNGPNDEPFDDNFDPGLAPEDVPDCHCHDPHEPHHPHHPGDRCHQGVDKYGFGILPAGTATLDIYGRPECAEWKEKATFWTASHVYNDPEQDMYVKVFDWKHSGVIQEAECPNPFYSVRLVKDFDGENYYDSEYVEGVLYKTLLFPETKQVWLATNYARTEGFDHYGSRRRPEYTEVNGGTVPENRKVLFINEFNGEFWEKRELSDGETVVINHPIDNPNHKTSIYWKDENGEKHYINVDSADSEMKNLEYRVFVTDDCKTGLFNTDDLVVKRVVKIMGPMLDAERRDRIMGDARLARDIEHEREARRLADAELAELISGNTEAIEGLREDLEQEISARTEADEALGIRIDEEASARTEADEALGIRIDEEISARTEADEALGIRIDEEISARTEADEALDAKIEAETERAIAREDEVEGETLDIDEEYTIHVNGGLLLKLKNGTEVPVAFDGNYGEF